VTCHPFNLLSRVSEQSPLLKIQVIVSQHWAYFASWQQQVKTKLKAMQPKAQDTKDEF